MSDKDKERPVRPWDLFKADNRVSAEVYIERYDICKACPELIQTTKTCKKCGCFMAQKTKLPAASCPLGKWDAVKKETE